MTGREVAAPANSRFRRRVFLKLLAVTEARIGRLCFQRRGHMDISGLLPRKFAALHRLTFVLRASCGPTAGSGFPVSSERSARPSAYSAYVSAHSQYAP